MKQSCSGVKMKVVSEVLSEGAAAGGAVGRTISSTHLSWVFLLVSWMSHKCLWFVLLWMLQLN